MKLLIEWIILTLIKYKCYRFNIDFQLSFPIGTLRSSCLIQIHIHFAA